MKINSKVTALVLLTALFFGIGRVPAMASGCSPEEYLPLTPEQIIDIHKTNEKIEAYMQNRVSPLGDNFYMLSVPLYQQEKYNYCGVACTQMVLDYLTDIKYSQSTLADDIGTEEGGSSSNGIVKALNKYLGAGTYQVTTIYESDFWDSLVYGRENGYPLVCSVKEMPSYTSTSGHFIVLTGYGYFADGTEAVAYNDPIDNDDYFAAGKMTLDQAIIAIDSNVGKFIRCTK